MDHAYAICAVTQGPYRWESGCFMSGCSQENIPMLDHADMAL